MDNFSFKRLYLQLDEATVSFNGDPDMVRSVECAMYTGSCLQLVTSNVLVLSSTNFLATIDGNLKCFLSEKRNYLSGFS